jgi:hypothetical protein
MRFITKMILFPFQKSIFDPFSAGLGILSFGFSVLSGSSAKKDQRRREREERARRGRQAVADAATARLNAEQLGIQKEAFGRQSEEQISDIGEAGASVSAERAALAAAEGFGGGGTARSVQAGISRKVSRDIMRVRDSLTEQTDIFNLQIKQQEEQAEFFDIEATFAGGSGSIFGSIPRRRDPNRLSSRFR